MSILLTNHSNLHPASAVFWTCRRCKPSRSRHRQSCGTVGCTSTKPSGICTDFCTMTKHCWNYMFPLPSAKWRSLAKAFSTDCSRDRLLKAILVDVYCWGNFKDILMCPSVRPWSWQSSTIKGESLEHHIHTRANKTATTPQKIDPGKNFWETIYIYIYIYIYTYIIVIYIIFAYF